MKRFVLLIVIVVFSVFVWSCNEETTAPMSATEPKPDVESEVESGAEFNPDRFSATAEYEVVLENLTPLTGPASSQPFSPPILVTHKSGIRLFKPGKYASNELRQIAEDAVNGPMVEKLKNSDKVYQVVEGGSTPIFPGESATFSIQAERGYNRISLVSMLVNTNDAFTGITRAKLPRHGKRVYYLYAYDAGTEKNTELTAHIPGPCCGSPLVRVPTHHKIKFHRGIRGIGDLDSAIYDWNRKVAKLTISRVN